MKFNYFIIAALLLTGLSSCNKWLDVNPKTEIESAVAFQDEQGFKDALTGLYVKMASAPLYGRELTYGYLEVLAKQYPVLPNSSTYYQASLYNYLDTASRSRMDNIWNIGYNMIANDNNLIENLNTANVSMFAANNYNVIKGEAYGLRAFMHFDLLRLYARSPASAGGITSPGIPYSEFLDKRTSATLPVGEVINKVLADLDVAASLLKTADPIVPGSGVAATGFLRDRQYKFNYYAVKALQARVYLYINDRVKALECAREVIQSGAFTFTPNTQIVNNTEEFRNKLLTQELVFSLNVPTLQTDADPYFNVINGELSILTTDFNQIYESNLSDLRYVYISRQNADNTRRYSSKLVGPTGSKARVPVIRWSELYYIAAECLKDTDPGSSVNYLNLVRRQRNVLNDLSAADLTAEQIQNEIFKEYRKEFVAEGQLFYYYKRVNRPTIEFSTVAANDNIYVLPKPDNQIEYGN
ncbi:hypothetical protein PBAL39_22100 [Pedobacter sp. BAL39]|uniref:RagB/SusD family nutrient uptake outer membrane protein n=1 Tax=Pedobacter sp. BAL39 TaxID=391596 RepID=UPI000155937C|nr:RagB/SusD family nutrient uptake outer membrane protein [Pedobacter sp. BAL39]EDM38811.1 hypothetical protein PBAL39_22100 [Pedobacter sp. BAL39]